MFKDTRVFTHTAGNMYAPVNTEVLELGVNIIFYHALTH